MLRNVFSYGGLLLLTGAAVLAMPGSVRAQRHGSGHFGGGHVGGGHFGGGHVGYYHGGYHGGYPHTYYHHPYYGNHHFYPFYGYGYPYYAYSYPYLYDTYPYVASSPTYDSGYYGSYGYGTPSYPNLSASVTAPSAGYQYQAFYPPTTAESDTSAHVTVSVPAGARLWFDNTPTTSTGPVREFYSPPLTSGKQYTYDVKASWTENGHEVTQTQKVEVTPGARVNLTFPVPPKTAGQASTVTRR
jgi:uncharacterized protein (TIGR03000 family)